MSYVVIENTPGYLPDEDELAEFMSYGAAVAYLREQAQEYKDDGCEIEWGLASYDNLAACRIHDPSKMHDLGRVIQIVKGEDSA